MMCARRRSSRVLVKSIGLKCHVRPEHVNRFVPAFQAVWRELPLSARRLLCRDWKEKGLPVIGVLDRVEDAKGRLANGICRHRVDGSTAALIFGTKAVASLSEPALRGLVAHELAHAHLGIAQGLIHFEGDANRLVDSWGLWTELDSLMIEGEDEGVLPAEEAQRRQLYFSAEPEEIQAAAALLRERQSLT